MWHNGKWKQRRDHRLLLSMKTVNLNGNSFLPHPIFIFIIAAVLVELQNWSAQQAKLRAFFLNLLTSFFILKGRIIKSEDIWECPLMIWVPHLFSTPQHTSNLLWKKEEKVNTNQTMQTYLHEGFFLYQCLRCRCKECCNKAPSCLWTRKHLPNLYQRWHSFLGA